jgi:tetratricopeptide (TPR) repeat protein
MAGPPPEKLRRVFEAYARGSFNETFRLCRHVAAAKPALFEAWRLLGIVQAAMGEREPALASYDRALSLQPRHSEARVNRGAVLHDLGRYEEALAEYDRALIANGDNALAHANRPAQGVAGDQRRHLANGQ